MVLRPNIFLLFYPDIFLLPLGYFALINLLVFFIFLIISFNHINDDKLLNEAY